MEDKIEPPYEEIPKIFQDEELLWKKKRSKRISQTYQHFTYVIRKDIIFGDVNLFHQMFIKF
jgi:hypothetical protein